MRKFIISLIALAALMSLFFGSVTAVSALPPSDWAEALVVADDSTDSLLLALNVEGDGFSEARGSIEADSNDTSSGDYAEALVFALADATASSDGIAEASAFASKSLAYDPSATAIATAYNGGNASADADAIMDGFGSADAIAAAFSDNDGSTNAEADAIVIGGSSGYADASVDASADESGKAGALGQASITGGSSGNTNVVAVVTADEAGTAGVTVQANITGGSSGNAGALAVASADQSAIAEATAQASIDGGFSGNNFAAAVAGATGIDSQAYSSASSVTNAGWTPPPGVKGTYVYDFLPGRGYAISIVYILPDGTQYTVAYSFAAPGVYSNANAEATNGTSTNFAATGIIHHIVITPEDATITADDSITYTALAYDSADQLLGDITGDTVFTISSGANGSWDGNEYEAATVGTWTVTGTYTLVGGIFTDTASLTVNHGVAVGITVSPDSATITADDTQTYTVDAWDADDNHWNATAETTFGISGGTGTFTGATYTAVSAGGPWTVTGTHSDGPTDTASLTVTHGTATTVNILPATASITTGQTQTYTASANDADGNTWNAIPGTAFTISGGTGTFGGPNNATYTAASTGGPWTVTGTYGAVHAHATMTVTAATYVLDHIHISGPSGNGEHIHWQGTGGTGHTHSATYTATAYTDAGHSNPLVVTADTVWSFTGTTPAGSWSGNVFTAGSGSADGEYTVTGTYTLGGITRSASQTPQILHIDD